MPINILMPALSPTMEEGAIAKWLVKEGDAVASGDVLCEIETDKAVMEFEAVDEGVLARIVVPEGTPNVKVNDLIAILIEEGETLSDAEPAAAPAQPAPAAAPPAPAAPAPSAPAAPRADDAKRVFASPLARRIAAEKGLDLTAMQGSGPHGRIVKADVEAARPAPSAPAPTETPQATPAPTAAPDSVRKLYADAPFEEIPLDGMRKIIAARLVEAKQTIPHFYLRRDIELDALLAFRAQLNGGLEKRGVKLSINDFIIKACALALQQIPDCNAVWAGDRILKFSRSDVAVAVSIEGGLFTPVLRGAESKSLSALSAEMKDLAARARTRKLAPHDYQGGSFAISNLGMMGIDSFDAVINPPHASILAIGAGVRKPVVRGEDIVPATVMTVTLSVDHRVIDGALGARFLDAIKGNLEDPLTMLA